MRNLIVVSGYAGSGKTEFSLRLAESLKAVLIDKDPASRLFTEALLKQEGLDPHDRESNFYLTTVRPLEYQQMENIALENIQIGNSVVLSAPFVKEIQDLEWFNDFFTKTRSAGASLEIVYVYCSPDVMHHRLNNRGASRDSWKLANWQTYSKNLFESIKPVVPHHFIDNSQDSPTCVPEEQFEKLLKVLK
jgi:predicted kinase